MGGINYPGRRGSGAQKLVESWKKLRRVSTKPGRRNYHNKSGGGVVIGFWRKGSTEPSRLSLIPRVGIRSETYRLENANAEPEMAANATPESRLVSQFA